MLIYTGGTDLKHFEFNYRLFEGPWIIIQTNKTTTRVTGLQANSLYQFRVRYVSVWGKGNYITSKLVLSHHIGAPTKPHPPTITCWTYNKVCLHLLTNKTNRTILVYRNDSLISMDKLSNTLLLNNVSYHPNVQFALVVANEWGYSEQSQPSLTGNPVYV